MAKQKYIWVYTIIVFMIMGQISEIKNQQIYLGDNIKQYALIQYIDSGASYTDLCPDCTCSLDILNKVDGLILDDAVTTELSQGLFAYKTTSDYFSQSQTYHTIFNCTSVLYGSGLAYSQVDILDSPPLQTGLRPQQDTPVLIGTQSIIGDVINGLIGGGTGDIIDSIIGRIDDPIGSILGLPKALQDMYNAMIELIAGTIYFFIKFAGILLLLLTSPADGLKAMISLFWEYLRPLITWMAVPIVLYEFYIITFKAINQPFEQALKTLLEAQLTIIGVFKKIIDEAIRYVMILINLVINAIGAINPF